MSFVWDTYSDTGSRDKNEDSLSLKAGDKVVCAALGDGMGGYRGGEIASGLLVQAFENAFEQKGTVDVRSVVLTANESIIARQKELGFKMKTTAAVVKIDDAKVSIAHVGDSRVYAFREGRLAFRTVDHSAAQMCVDVGEITPDQIRSHPDRCVLTRALGSAETVKVELDELDVNGIDSLLICSDGFWGSVLEDEMCACLVQSRTPGEWLDRMREIRHGRVTDDDDNNSAIAIMKGKEG